MREFEIRRIAHRSQNVPGRGNQQRDQQAAERMQRLPNSRLEQLPR